MDAVRVDEQLFFELEFHKLATLARLLLWSRLLRHVGRRKVPLRRLLLVHFILASLAALDGADHVEPVLDLG